MIPSSVHRAEPSKGGADVLTREELEALLELVGPGPAEPPAGAAPARRFDRPADPYDFSRRSLLSERELALLESAMSRAARAIGVALSRLIKQPAVISPPGFQTLSARTFLESLPRPCVVHTLRAGGPDERALLALDVGFQAAAVDLLLGGTGVVSCPIGREATRAELALGRRLADEVVGGLMRALREVAAFELTLHATGTDPRVVDCLPATEPMLVFELLVDAGPLGGPVRLALPARALARGLEAAATPVPRRDRPGLEQAAAVRGLPLEVTAVLGEAAMPLRSLLELEVGDIVRIGRRPGEPVEVRLPGGRTLQARPARRDGRVVVEVVPAA